MPLYRHATTSTTRDRRELRIKPSWFAAQGRRFTRSLPMFAGVALAFAVTFSMTTDVSATPAEKEPLNVTFKTMATYPVEPSVGPVPEVFQQLDGAVVTLTGYMLPLTFNQGRTRDFMLMRSQAACCFGQTPKANEFVFVTAAPADGVVAVQDVPLAFTGVLRVRPVKEGESVVQCFFLEDARAR